MTTIEIEDLGRERGRGGVGHIGESEGPANILLLEYFFNWITCGTQATSANGFGFSHLSADRWAPLLVQVSIRY
jgi:hypothetical protein